MKDKFKKKIALLLKTGWQKTYNFMRFIRNKIFLKWRFWPPIGEPRLLSAYEFIFYISLLVLCFVLYREFNDVPIKRIELSADRIDNHRSIDTLTTADGNYNLRYQCAYMTLQLPMFFKDQDNPNPEYPLFKAAFRTDSMPLRCFTYSDIFKKRLHNTTPMSRYWNIVFEKAVRDGSEMLPSPNSMVDNQYYILRDKYDFARKKTLQKVLDSCFYELQKNQEQFKDRSNTFHMKLFYTNSKEKVEKSNDQWEEDSITYSELNGITPHIYTSKNESHNISEAYFTSIPIAWIHSARSMRERDNDFNDAECSINTKNEQTHPSWFALYDVSQSKFHITISTSTIDSIRLEVNYIGAVNVWPSIIPDKQVGTSLIYEDQLKVLEIRHEGLTVFVESKELTNMQSIRLFVLSAIFSGLVIIIITFTIIAIHRICNKTKE